MDFDDLKKLKIAIISDTLDQRGGGSRFVLAMHKILPNSEIFAPIWDKDLFPELERVHTGFIQSPIFRKTFLKHAFFYLMPFVYENYDFTGFDLVISAACCAGKAAITGIDQPYIEPPDH
jgi:hypothetical protein